MHNSKLSVAGSLVLTPRDYIVQHGALTPGVQQEGSRELRSLLPGKTDQYR